ncbi:conserved hypothetical protein [Talaromyces stipitatus ATCC 10500]|uniref:FRG1-like family protein n=1 Tax=Talaromyces stipitatus (strain ATCC 10500 / CBS 375.48 / QM 6759 / NRRL 1006) TaxID=441959 RepID=B8MGN8_TALSN|nr:uncharacterized protein TSTA_018570 [Talaromyces stipitatus ATCC 10500]XP_002484024.1 uncharacterized protein TSTA_018570 [Talaromyces stipitatus ATCC 10500]EED16789.1 conserved hypothetical protein [Talaromyces stipitatus ATCC 10500]EED16790.1 conserved hypothetical protein [Talaromyces stipitatus ATCC 10500]
MVKPLSFKGDKKTKKRKHRDDDSRPPTTSTDLVTQQQQPDEQSSTTQEDQTWVSADVPTDINGPVIIVLPSTPIPTCIACDANGAVFASELENTIDNDPRTAEPHDVRQVWVATRVAGTEGVSFKGHHGRYLSCDKYGILSATATAISPFEMFVAMQAPDTPGMMALQTRGGEGESDTFITISEKPSTTAKKNNDNDGDQKNRQIDIRGDASTITFSSSLRIRMQARFKPKLKASRESKAKEKISRKELEATVGRRLEDHEVKRLKKARKEGNYYEEVLDVRVKGKHDKFAS